MGYITQVIDEAIGGHRVVKLFGGQDYEKLRFDEEELLVGRNPREDANALNGLPQPRKRQLGNVCAG